MNFFFILYIFLAFIYVCLIVTKIYLRMVQQILFGTIFQYFIEIIKFSFLVAFRNLVWIINSRFILKIFGLNFRILLFVIIDNFFPLFSIVSFFL